MFDSKGHRDYIVQASKKYDLKKLIFPAEGQKEKFYYAVTFYFPEENSIDICLSSQLGCSESCKFCATGDHKFIRNLSTDEIHKQLKAGIDSLSYHIKNYDPQMLYIIWEGMGEPTYNIRNCFEGVKKSKPFTIDKFRDVRFRLSTIGNLSFIEDYKDLIRQNRNGMENVQFQIQLSLHSPFDKEREKLISNVSKRYNIEETRNQFYDLASFLKWKLKLNYMLLNFPDGNNNYSEKHLKEMKRLFDPDKVKIKLTKYSETRKNFSSPPNEVYEEFKGSLEDSGFDVIIRDLIGEDVNAACGMLHYENLNSKGVNNEQKVRK